MPDGHASSNRADDGLWAVVANNLTKHDTWAVDCRDICFAVRQWMKADAIPNSAADPYLDTSTTSKARNATHRRLRADVDATRNRVEVAAEFLWEAYKRGNYPGQPAWADVNEVQRNACLFDARGLLEKVYAT